MVYIALKDIVSLSNVRDVKADETLISSMQNNGQEVEIQVYPIDGGKYAVKFGHRRVDAARQLGWTEIRAVIVDAPQDEVTLMIAQTVENEHRSGMSYLGRAQVYTRLKELGLSQHEIAIRCGISDSDVSLALAVLRADPRIQQALDQGRLKPSAVEPLLSLDKQTQAVLADAAIQAKTVRKVAALVATHLKQREAYVSKKSIPETSADVEDPMSTWSLAELVEGIGHLENAEYCLRDQVVVRTARPSVERLLAIAANLKEVMDGQVWDDMKDLL